MEFIIEQGGAEIWPDLTATAVTVSLSGTTATSSQLPAGKYLMVSTVDFHAKVGTSAVTATTSDFLLPSGQVFTFRVTQTSVNDYIAAITDGGTGTLYLVKAGAAG